MSPALVGTAIDRSQNKITIHFAGAIHTNVNASYFELWNTPSDTSPNPTGYLLGVASESWNMDRTSVTLTLDSSSSILAGNYIFIKNSNQGIISYQNGLAIPDIYNNPISHYGWLGWSGLN